MSLPRLADRLKFFFSKQLFHFQSFSIKMKEKKKTPTLTHMIQLKASS